MGTNSTGCSEWERDFDPATEQPFIVDTNLEILKTLHTGLRLKPSNDVLIAAVMALLENAIYEHEARLASINRKHT
jgi:hypothetical protein